MADFPTQTHCAQVCVIGGGLSGMAAAISSARRGASTVLIQDRPMLGGNASSEIRMWICGARGRDMRETGLLEEWIMENQYRNPDRNYHVWDGVLWGAAKQEQNLKLILNCAVSRCEMDRQRIVSVEGFQATTQVWHKVEAEIFIDCSGDSVLAPLTGAAFMQGREARDTFGESIAPELADYCTMGMSCMLQARQELSPSKYTPPEWAYHYTYEDLPYRVPNLDAPGDNFWYLELGGDQDCIGDAEEIRDELLKTAYGLWDYVKNAPENQEKNANWHLDWVGILPGKRESRRYVGQYTMHQCDVEAGGLFEDIIAYGGWTMDDHHPGGFRSKEVPTIHHPAPSPFGIPYRCLVAKDIDNLMFAGRNISVTHAALSATRVMATCAMLGQAAGTAAAMACELAKIPRQLDGVEIRELQQRLMDDDCYLPGINRMIPEITTCAKLVADVPDAENLRNGYDRSMGEQDNGARIPIGHAVEYRFEQPRRVERVRLVFDSDLNRDTFDERDRKLNRNMLANRPLNWPEAFIPPVMTKAYTIEWMDESGEWQRMYDVKNNRKRLCIHVLQINAMAVRFTPTETFGAESSHVFSFEVM